MEFRLEFDPKPLAQKINISDKILLIGSCFTDHMFTYLSTYKFQCIQNPHGTLFNPISIFNAIEQYIHNTSIKEESLFQHNGLWNHWDFHSKMSDTEQAAALVKMNNSISQAHHFLTKSNWLIVTLGSGFVYEFNDAFIVANCHKIPGSSFTKRMLSIDEIEKGFNAVYSMLKSINPEIKILFTISPVRHLRDGFVENNRSKALLHHTVGKFVNDTDIFYFPSFELIVDDLRDYRFYAEDMVHPNYQATQYVWEKFCLACIDGKTKEIIKELDQIYSAVKHKPLHPDSVEHKKFKEKYKSISLDLSNRCPELNLEKEIAHFTEN